MLSDEEDSPVTLIVTAPERVSPGVARRVDSSPELCPAWLPMKVAKDTGIWAAEALPPAAQLS